MFVFVFCSSSDERARAGVSAATARKVSAPTVDSSTHVVTASSNGASAVSAVDSNDNDDLTLLKTHVWFATLPEAAVKSLLAMCEAVPTDKFRGNSSRGDVGFENEPSYEITTTARRQVNFGN